MTDTGLLTMFVAAGLLVALAIGVWLGRTWGYDDGWDDCEAECREVYLTMLNTDRQQRGAVVVLGLDPAAFSEPT
jgi:hypothetical protein